MNIAFIGYRGTGKTTVSTRLAELLNWWRIESDKEIEKKYSLAIPEIVNLYGWTSFRKTEKIILKSLSSLDRAILDLGGGAVLHEKCLQTLKEKSTFVVLLTCHEDTIVGRLNQNHNRPPLTELDLKKEIHHVLEERNGLYYQFADITVDTGTNSVDNAIEKIVNSYKKSIFLSRGRRQPILPECLEQPL